ncbi:MAG: winged helix-turn-helix transcriptional regulator [Candidatus Eremiobacteraeota bacterium]|nr:winged helix-turn-helix transcriptional regulator [Candidatus Eremiobacteraeota bacterium]
MKTDGRERTFEALGDATRRSIVEALRRGPATVGDLAKRLPVTRPAVSQHLKVLKEAQLVRDRQDGTRRIYQLDPEGLARVREYLDAVWERALRELKATAEHDVRRKKR